MADTLKILGQSNPVASTLTTLYTVPAATSTTVSSLVVCNQSAITIKFRISAAVAGAADATAQYLYYDVSLAAKDTFVATIGATLAATDLIRVYVDNGSVSITAFGVEVT